MKSSEHLQAQGNFKFVGQWLEPWQACPESQVFYPEMSKKCTYDLFYSQVVYFFNISSMTHLHTYCNDRILEWRRNLLLRPWSWNRNLMKLTMQEQGQNAAAGEERERERKGEKQEVSFLKSWPRQCRLPWGICTQMCLSLRTLRPGLGMAPVAQHSAQDQHIFWDMESKTFLFGEKSKMENGTVLQEASTVCHFSTPNQTA